MKESDHASAPASAHTRVISRWPVILRWIARIWGLLGVAFLLLFIFGEGLNPARLTLREGIEALFFPLGVGAGLVLAWRREGLGGAITVGSLVIFYLLHALLGHGLPRGPWFALIATPGLMFLICRWLMRNRE